MRNLNKFRIIVPVFMLLLISSCEEEKGCTDRNALNFDAFAEKDDGSCLYSNVVFYAKYGAFNGIPVVKIDIKVDGIDAGSMGDVIYPSGPGNCSAPGTILFQLHSGRRVDWNATIYLANGLQLFKNGTVSPSRSLNCISINVTN